jgi:plasmid stabilization system protein ParE
MSYKKLVIKSTAAIEIEEVIAYYAAINMTLATKLEKEIRSSFLKIAKNPESFQIRYKTIRVIWLKSFLTLFIIFLILTKYILWLFGVQEKMFQPI